MRRNILVLIRLEEVIYENEDFETRMYSPLKFQASAILILGEEHAMQ